MTHDELEEALHEALDRVHAPDYQPPPAAFCALIGCAPGEGPVAVQSAIADLIRELEPVPGTPPGAHTRKTYDLLYSRYILKLTQEETAELLDISRSSVQRAQRAAQHYLARILWERGRAGRGRSVDEARQGTQAADWRAQSLRELASLQASAPGAVSDIGDVLGGVLKLQEAFAAGQAVDLVPGFIQPGLEAAIHPSVLRQILIGLIRRLSCHTSDEQIALFARLEGGDVQITLRTTVAAAHEVAEPFNHYLPIPEDVSVETVLHGQQVYLRVKVPSVGKTTVLVVDDNADMARFYERCTRGTRYHIVTTAQGEGVVDLVKRVAPEAIVLDVMLPDVDGWELLMRLHEDPETRWLPVLVCSVVRERELALSLGAADYLAKPIAASGLIEALDRALSQVPAGAPTFPTSSAAAC